MNISNKINGILVALLLLFFFFIPWIELAPSLLNNSNMCSCWDFVQNVNEEAKIDMTKPFRGIINLCNTSLGYFVYLLFLIPFLAVLELLFIFINHKKFRVINEIIISVLTFFACYCIMELKHEKEASLIGFGFLGTLFIGLYFIFKNVKMYIESFEK